MFESQPSSTPPNNALRLMFEESRKARAYAGICEATLYDAMEYYKLESHSRQSPEFNDVVQRLLARLQQLLDEGYGGVPSQDFSLIYQEILYATSTLPDAQSGLRDSPPYSDQQQFLFQSSSTSIIPSSVMPCDVPLGTIDNSINSGTHGVNVNDSWHAPGLVYNPASLDTSYPTGDGQHASHNVHATDGQRYILSNSDRNPTSIPAMDTTTYRCHDIDATDGIDSVADPMHGHQSFTCIAGSTHSSNIPSSSVPLYTVCPAPNSQSTLEEAFYLNCPTVSRTDNCDGASSFASDHEKGLSYRIANSWEVLIAEKHLAVVNMEQEHERSVQRVDGGWLYGPSHKTYVDSDNFKHSTTADNSMALVMNWNTSQSTHVTQTSSRNLDYTMIVGLFPEYAGTRSLTSNPLRFPHSGEGKQLSKTFQGYIIYLGNNATTKQVAHGVFYRWYGRLNIIHLR
ncbi:hypothetical protein VNI00_013374 [Paramarasmius palmivorus]|uniref:Uncharacterized protein n=1 Tax=Paramarasmius palmivorus TaxID=297713 RepID=A0AAW0C157_9AGAR